MGTIIIAGIPGAGKTTVIGKAREEVSVKFVNYGDLMFEAARSRGDVTNRDEIRSLPLDLQKAIQIDAAEKIERMGKVVVDTHCTIKTPKGFLPGLPVWVLERIKPEVIVLVEAYPSEIVERRAKDQTRIREKVAFKEIEEHQLMNRISAMSYAVLTGATVKIISNHNHSLMECVRDLVRIIEKGD
ncbi:MAG TPA: adenylate kinase [Thermoplasmata archaeon]|nr:adenylate kinase [Thermoplasmata archaeon]HIH97853.1 adenylate kinase [Thermoplasmata archaeon]